MVVGVDLVLVRQRRLVREDRRVRRRPEVREPRDQVAPAGLARPGERVPVEAAVGLALADHLPDADEGLVQLGAPLDGQHAQGRAPGLPHQVDLVLAEAVAEVVRQLERVPDGAVQRERRGRIEGVVGLAGPPLVEGDDDEILLEDLQVPAHGAEFAAARSAREEEQHGALGAVAADHQRQVVAAELDTRELGDAAGERLAVGTENRVGGRRASDRDGERDERDGDQRRHGTSGVERRARPAVTGRHAADATGVAGAEGGTEGHRHQREHAVGAAADRQGDQPVGAQADAVDRRSVGADTHELVRRHEGEGRQEQRPPGPQREAGHGADQEPRDHRRQRLRRRDRPARHQQREHRGGFDGDAQCEGGTEPPVAPDEVARTGERSTVDVWQAPVEARSLGPGVEHSSRLLSVDPYARHA